MLKSDFVNAAAEMFCVHPRDLVGPYRFNFLMLPRFALYKALRMRGWSYPQIGRFLNRDHSTIIHGVDRAEWKMERDAEYAAKVKALAELKMEASEPLEEAA